LQSLKSRRLANDLVLCYKLLYDNYDSSTTNTLNLCRNITRGHSYILSKPVCINDANKFLFTNRIVNVWNCLPITLLFLHQQLLFLRKDCLMLILTNSTCATKMLLFCILNSISGRLVLQYNTITILLI